MEELKRSITVVYAEDDPDDQLLLKEAWIENKIINTLHIVNNGVELLEYLRNEGDFKDVEKYPKPGLVLIDLKMPKMNGMEAVKEIKKEYRLKNIPIIIFTTSKSEEDMFRSYNLGVSSFITKPVSYEEMIKMFSVFKNYWLEIVQFP